MSRKIHWQRCFKIDKDRLNLFLIKLGMMDTQTSYFEAEYIFQTEEGYDVVVSEYNGSYPFQEEDIEEFAKNIKPKERKNGHDKN